MLVSSFQQSISVLDLVVLSHYSYLGLTFPIYKEPYGPNLSSNG
jgi:hypothetical protein